MFKITIRKLCLFSSCKQAGWGCFLQPCFFLDVCDIQRNISNLSIHIAFVCSFSGGWGVAAACFCTMELSSFGGLKRTQFPKAFPVK
uniref:Putative secreted protein n=1 Tax=Ixodes ricinus TaxID=34613 RepID=A0A6B0U1V8_IXORI